MSKPGYYVQVAPVERAEHAEWWGHGGAELMDEIDPLCATENESFWACGGRIGPIDPDKMANWVERAEKIPGWGRGTHDLACPILIYSKGV